MHIGRSAQTIKQPTDRLSCEILSMLTKKTDSDDKAQHEWDICSGCSQMHETRRGGQSVEPNRAS